MTWFRNLTPGQARLVLGVLAAVLAVLAKYFPGLAAELVIAAAALRSPLSDHPPVPAKEETPDES